MIVHEVKVSTIYNRVDCGLFGKNSVRGPCGIAFSRRWKTYGGRLLVKEMCVEATATIEEKKEDC
jgi:hypothetical protein